jgi:NAD dependent epimerase/dehydratase family enzyme
MGRSGGSLPPLLLGLKLGAGSVMGNGRQFVSWIHIEDALGVIAHAVRDTKLSGPVNAVAPESVSYEAFMHEAGAIAHRPVWLKIPEQLLRKALGEMAIMLVEGPCVLPGKLRTLHHEFRFRTLKSALTDLV